MPNIDKRSVPVDFVALANRWCSNYSSTLLSFVWRGYDLLLSQLPAGINVEDLERSITQSLEWRIRKVMSGYEPFGIQHSPFERETKKAPPAQPPAYDLAFFLYADEKVMWPLEAKVLITDAAVGDYVNDVKNEFLTCRYAPFSSEGAMLGYLLAGVPETAFQNLASKIPCTLVAHPFFPERSSKISDHLRDVRDGKPYPQSFRCHHLILKFPGLTKTRKRKSSGAASEVK